jgi:hypothetical protein
MSRATVFLTVLSASIIALALLADATGFGSETMTAALVLLPIVLLLGIAAYARLVQINTEEFLIKTPTIVATVNSALAAAIVVLLLDAAEAPRAAAIVGGAAAFMAVWGVLLRLHSRRSARCGT